MAHKRVEMAEREGSRFGPVVDADIWPGLTIEQELDFIATAAVGRRIYYGSASVLERELTLEDQRKILVLLRALGRAVFRKNFDGMCAGELLHEDTPSTAPDTSNT